MLVASYCSSEPGAVYESGDAPDPVGCVASRGSNGIPAVHVPLVVDSAPPVETMKSHLSLTLPAPVSTTTVA